MALTGVLLVGHFFYMLEQMSALGEDIKGLGVRLERIEKSLETQLHIYEMDHHEQI